MGRFLISYDRYGFEADAAAHLDDGRYAIIKVMLGSAEIEKRPPNLNKFEDSPENAGMRKPRLIMILGGNHLACTRHDGLLAVPIGCRRNQWKMAFV